MLKAVQEVLAVYMLQRICKSLIGILIKLANDNKDMLMNYTSAINGVIIAPILALALQLPSPNDLTVVG